MDDKWHLIIDLISIFLTSEIGHIFICLSVIWDWLLSFLLPSFDPFNTRLFCHSYVAQLIKNLSAVWETWVRSLSWEDPLENEQLPTPIFWPGEFHRLYSPWGHKQSDTTEWLSLFQNSVKEFWILNVPTFASMLQIFPPIYNYFLTVESLARGNL